MAKVMRAFELLAAIADKAWPQTWPLFAALDKQFENDPRFAKLLKDNSIENPIKTENVTEDHLQFMMELRKSLFLPPLYDLTIVLLQSDAGIPDCPHDESGLPCDCTCAVIPLTKDSLKRTLDSLDRKDLTDATGYDGEFLDRILDVLCSTILQFIVENGCEIRISEVPLIYKVAS